MNIRMRELLDRLKLEPNLFNTPMQNEALKYFCCPNEKCSLHGVQGRHNISVRAKSGQNGIRLLRCRKCNHTFSERRGTVLDNSRIDPQKIVCILKYLDEGKSQREIARLLDVDRSTVGRYSKLAGGNVKALHDKLAAVLSDKQKGTVRHEVRLNPRKKHDENGVAQRAI